MNKSKIKNGVEYFSNYKNARAIRNALYSGYKNARVVSYGMGYAIQYQKSGPYYPENGSV